MNKQSSRFKFASAPDSWGVIFDGTSFAVDRDDNAAPSPQQFVDAEVLDMAAIGQEYETGPLARRYSAVGDRRARLEKGL